jgi:two-component system CheB/CheR fusion protein
MKTGDRSTEGARPRPDRSAVPAPSTQSRQAAPERAEFPVVAIGASAGGLETFRKLFDALPADAGMAFILIQHLDPSHVSLMVDLLAGHTTNIVRQASDGMPLEPGNVYVIPPGAYLAIRGGTLHLSEPQERHGARLPIDFFLRSFAAERGRRANCVILSGTGADGTLGLKAIKE